MYPYGCGFDYVIYGISFSGSFIITQKNWHDGSILFEQALFVIVLHDSHRIYLMCKISMVRAAEAVQTTLANKFDAVFSCCNVMVMVITKTSFEELVTI